MRVPAGAGSSLVLLAALGLLAVSGCGPAKPVELSIYAAASTKDALLEIQPRYEAENVAVKLVFNFASSGDLARQILAANKADVFLSADELELERVAAQGLVLEGSRRPLLSNQLVVIEPIDPRAPASSVFAAPFGPSQIACERIERLSLADVDTVPAGRYAKQWLEEEAVWAAIQAKVLPAVDVRAALAAVEAGAAQAGIVYRTDAARSGKVRIVHAVPLSEGPPISYPLAVLGDRPQLEAARRFADYLGGAEAREAFERHGFLVLGGERAAGQ